MHHLRTSNLAVPPQFLEGENPLLETLLCFSNLLPSAFLVGTTRQTLTVSGSLWAFSCGTFLDRRSTMLANIAAGVKGAGLEITV